MSLIEKRDSVESSKNEMVFKLNNWCIQELYSAFCHFAKGFDKIPKGKLREVLLDLGQNLTDEEMQVCCIEY